MRTYFDISGILDVEPSENPDPPPTDDPIPRHPQGRFPPQILQAPEPDWKPSFLTKTVLINPAPMPTPSKSVTIRMIAACWVGVYIPSLLEYNFYCLQPAHPTGGHPQASGRPESVVVWRRVQTILVYPRQEKSSPTLDVFARQPKSAGSNPCFRTASQICAERAFQSKLAVFGVGSTGLTPGLAESDSNCPRALSKAPRVRLILPS